MALLTLNSCRDNPKPSTKSGPQNLCQVQRIVSFAPSLTEMLFALDLGDRIIAVDRYSNYPAAAQLLPRIGGYLDPNLEALLQMQPDAVVLFKNHQEVITLLQRFKIPVVACRCQNVQDIFDSMTLLGQTFGRESQATALRTDLEQRWQALCASGRDRLKRRAPIRVLLVIWRERGTGQLRNIDVSGQDGYFSAMIEAAGGVIVPADTRTAYPRLSQESLLELDPQVILELAPELAQADATKRQQALDDWHVLAETEAVREKRLHLITEDYASIPGPRFILLAEQIVALLDFP